MLSLWEEFGHFHSAQFSWVTNVIEGLDLIQMHKVMNHPEVIVVVHGDIKVLHSFRSGSTFGDGSINLEFSFHECSVFGLDFTNNIWGMNALFIRIPINWSHTFSAGGGLVVIVKDT